VLKLEIHLVSKKQIAMEVLMMRIQVLNQLKLHGVEMEGEKIRDLESLQDLSQMEGFCQSLQCSSSPNDRITCEPILYFMMGK
jgi:hypothetical protein